MVNPKEYFADYAFFSNQDQGKWGDWLKSLERFESYEFSHDSLASHMVTKTPEMERAINSVVILADAIKELRVRGIKRLPADSIGQVSQAAVTCCNFADHMRDETLQNNKRRNEMIEQCLRDTSEHYRQLSSSFAISANGLDVRALSRIQENAKDILGSIQSIKSNAEEQSASIREESSKVIEELKKELKDKLASDEASRFAELANGYKQAASVWLSVSCVLALLVIGGAVSFYVHAARTQEELSTAKAIQLSVAKLVVVSVASFMLFTSVRNYRANQHNQVLATNRATTMEVYRAFLLSVESQEAKDKLLCLVAEMAFNIRQTGYDFSDREGGHPLQQVFDIHNLTRSSST